MGAYENPTIIRDRSGEIYGQAIASFSQSIAKGITAYGQAIAASNKKAQEKIERNQRIANDIETNAYKQAHQNFAKVTAKTPSLIDQFKTTVKDLLDGDENNMGAIEAETLLKVRNDLTKDERKKYRNIVNKAQSFQTLGVEGGAKMITDLEEVKNVLPQDITNTHYWVGDTDLEQDTSMLTSYILSNKELDGFSGEKQLIAGDNGEMIVSVKSKVDKNSELFKNLNEETKQFLENNNYEIKWERDINKWNEGLVDEIASEINYNEISITNGFETKEGSVAPAYIAGDENAVRQIEYGDQFVPVRYINVDGFLNSKSFLDEIKGKAESYIARGNGQLQSFMVFKMKDGDFNIGEFKKKTQDKQVEEVSSALIESWKKNKLPNFIQRNATEKDVQNLRALGENVKKGQPIYLQQAGPSKSIPASSYVQTLGDKIVNEVINIKITPMQTIGGLAGDEVSVVENADRVRNANIEIHKNYLRSKGINAKSKTDLVKQLEKLKGTKDSTGQKIDDEYIKAFKDSAQELYVYDAENKKQYELPSYNPDSNESLLPILNQYGGFGAKTKERISTIDAIDWGSEKK